METILEKLAQKTTWLGVFAVAVPLLVTFGVDLPVGVQEVAAQALAGIAGLVLIFVDPK